MLQVFGSYFSVSWCPSGARSNPRNCLTLSPLPAAQSSSYRLTEQRLPEIQNWRPHRKTWKSSDAERDEERSPPVPAEMRGGAFRPVPIDLPYPQAALVCSLQTYRALAGALITQSTGSLFHLLAFTTRCRLSCSEPVAVQHPGQEPPHKHLPPVPASPAASQPAGPDSLS